MATVGTSVLESRKLGYLLDSDIVVPNKDELLYVAISQAKAMAAVPPPVRKVQELSATRMKECEFERTNYVITAHENTEPEDLLDPAYWSTVAAKLATKATIPQRS